MYCNCKDKEVRFDIDIRGTGVAVGSLADLRGSNRIVEQFAVLVELPVVERLLRAARELVPADPAVVEA